MEKWTGKIAVVTGASSGIGKSISLALARAGLKVFGLARRRERLDEVQTEAADFPGSFVGIQCDISNTKSIEEAFITIRGKVDKIHILINNAGSGLNATVLDASKTHQDFLDIFNVIFMGTVVCTREAFNSMKTHKEPRYIINMNSIAGHSTPNPLLLPSNVYPAATHAVTNHTELLRLQFANSEENLSYNDIRVTNLSPGTVKTEFFATAEYDMRNFEGMAHLNPQDIADAVIYLLSLPPHINVSQFTIQPTGEKM